MKAILLCLYFTVFRCVLYAQSTLIEGQSVIGKGLWSQNVSGISHSSNYAIGVSNKYAFGEQSNTRNERGLYSAINLDLSRKWTL
jgi:hypothetical protein